jgi:flagellar motility protein MotE (MotC chaperone)
VTRIRLLPIVLFGVTALLCLKLVGLVAGVGSFAVGPPAATAAGAGGGHGEAAAPATPAPVDFPGPLVDLAAEAEALKKQQESAGHGASSGHGAEPAEVATGHGVTAVLPSDAADGTHATDLPSDQTADGDEPPAPHADADMPEQEAGQGAEAAASGHGEAGDGHGETSAATPAVTTVRPGEYDPADLSSETLVLQTLAERRKALETREADIANRERLLQAAEQRLQARIDELKSLETQLGGAPSELAQEDDEKIKGLVSMYEAMKPKAAARVFDGLDMGVLIAVSRAMSPRKMSAIMAVMDPDKAGLLTTALAGSQAPREVVVRRNDADYAAPGGTASPMSPNDLPKIMPATSTEPPPG